MRCLAATRRQTCPRKPSKPHWYKRERTRLPKKTRKRSRHITSFFRKQPKSKGKPLQKEEVASVGGLFDFTTVHFARKLAAIFLEKIREPVYLHQIPQGADIGGSGDVGLLHLKRLKFRDDKIAAACFSGETVRMGPVAIFLIVYVV